MNLFFRMCSTLALSAAPFLAACDNGLPQASSSPRPATPAPAPAAADSAQGAAQPQAPAAPPAATAPQAKPLPPADDPISYVLMSTDMGDIIIQLDREHAPISVDNFLAYVDEKYYDGTIFHRVMKTFMIQGGGFTSDMKQKTPSHSTIKNEWQNGLKNLRGTIAMARLGGQPDSASCQFFINVVDNAGLDQPQRDGAGYAVFGKVVAGMDAVDKIRNVAVGNNGPHQNVPLQPILIKSVSRISADQAAAAAKPAASMPAATAPTAAQSH